MEKDDNFTSLNKAARSLHSEKLYPADDGSNGIAVLTIPVPEVNTVEKP
jgi:hypothetical protein